MARVWVLLASEVQRRELDVLLASFSARASWLPQRHTPKSFQCVVEVNSLGSEVASELAAVGCVFEVEEASERFLYHPGLGLHRHATDEAGEPVIRAGQIANELVASGGNLAEFERRLRLLCGTPWLDVMEAYRLEMLRLDAIPRAV